MTLAHPDPGAGGVVLNADGDVLLVRYRSGGWTFPKGHLEPGETPEQTAVREVHEETGVHAHVIAPLQTTRYTNDRGVHREIRWFLMRTDQTGTELETLFDQGGFFDAHEARELLSYPQDQNLLREALSRSGS